jgi:hypothetical protein
MYVPRGPATRDVEEISVHPKNPPANGHRQTYSRINYVEVRQRLFTVFGSATEGDAVGSENLVGAVLLGVTIAEAGSTRLAFNLQASPQNGEVLSLAEAKAQRSRARDDRSSWPDQASVGPQFLPAQSLKYPAHTTPRALTVLHFV